MAYPADYQLDHPMEIENWRPLVQWILALPHFFVLWFLSIVGFVIAVVSWFTIAFTGVLSPSLAATQAMIIRYNVRVTAYAGFLYEEYPPFDFTSSIADPGGSPVTVEFTPALDDRDRLSSALRLIWSIPILIFAAIIRIAAQIVWLISVFVVLFTGRWSPGMHDFVNKSLRLQTRASAYFVLPTDEYPPFELE